MKDAAVLHTTIWPFIKKEWSSGLIFIFFSLQPVHVALWFSIISWFIFFGIYSAIATYIPGSAEMYGQVSYSMTMVCWGGGWRGLFQHVHVASWFSIISWFISFGIYSAIATYIPGSAEMYGQVRYSTVCHGGGEVVVSAHPCVIVV